MEKKATKKSPASTIQHYLVRRVNVSDIMWWCTHTKVQKVRVWCGQMNELMIDEEWATAHSTAWPGIRTHIHRQFFFFFFIIILIRLGDRSFRSFINLFLAVGMCLCAMKMNWPYGIWMDTQTILFNDVCAFVCVFATVSVAVRMCNVYVKKKNRLCVGIHIYRLRQLNSINIFPNGAAANSQ